MHDTLRYFSREPVHRRFHQDELTFAQLYEHSERFIMPLSHDEVVHGKRSLLEKMPGDAWQKFANLRLLLAYQWTRPGKKLLFMGTRAGAPRRVGLPAEPRLAPGGTIRRGRAWRGCSKRSAGSTASTPACGASIPIRRASHGSTATTGSTPSCLICDATAGTSCWWC